MTEQWDEASKLLDTPEPGEALRRNGRPGLAGYDLSLEEYVDYPKGVVTPNKVFTNAFLQR